MVSFVITREGVLVDIADGITVVDVDGKLDGSFVGSTEGIWVIAAVDAIGVLVETLPPPQ